jgi:hypothetical protein
VNLGDDADTTGAIYGQLAGTFYGPGRRRNYRTEGTVVTDTEWLKVLFLLRRLTSRPIRSGATLRA